MGRRSVIELVPFRRGLVGSSVGASLLFQSGGNPKSAAALREKLEEAQKFEAQKERLKKT